MLSPCRQTRKSLLGQVVFHRQHHHSIVHRRKKTAAIIIAGYGFFFFRPSYRLVLWRPGYRLVFFFFVFCAGGTHWGYQWACARQGEGVTIELAGICSGRGWSRLVCFYPICAGLASAKCRGLSSQHKGLTWREQQRRHGVGQHPMVGETNRPCLLP